MKSTTHGRPEGRHAAQDRNKKTSASFARNLAEVFSSLGGHLSRQSLVYGKALPLHRMLVSDAVTQCFLIPTQHRFICEILVGLSSPPAPSSVLDTLHRALAAAMLASEL
jgi:hypothetical protein